MLEWLKNTKCKMRLSLLFTAMWFVVFADIIAISFIQSSNHFYINEYLIFIFTLSPIFVWGIWFTFKK